MKVLRPRKKEWHSHKNFVDYFPEEHIVVASGLLLLVLGLLTVVPQLSSQGMSSGIATQPLTNPGMALTLWDAFLFGFFALAFVFVIVFLVHHYSKKI